MDGLLHTNQQDAYEAEGERERVDNQTGREPDSCNHQPTDAWADHPSCGLGALNLRVPFDKIRFGEHRGEIRVIGRLEEDGGCTGEQRDQEQVAVCHRLQEAGDREAREEQRARSVRDHHDRTPWQPVDPGTGR